MLLERLLQASRLGIKSLLFPGLGQFATLSLVFLGAIRWKRAESDELSRFLAFHALYVAAELLRPSSAGQPLGLHTHPRIGSRVHSPDSVHVPEMSCCCLLNAGGGLLIELSLPYCLTPSKTLTQLFDLESSKLLRQALQVSSRP